ncbi:uncharacterized protein LOC107982070 [Nasonia vitripennis]|uniref:Aminopeptidase N n=1 Tax=Nasonia vitripennis TaxID=7425 RepID=A0A7M7QJD4_NASVI|nr:uncharacterized protein LOC107982070 [Nasonia vitripennis]
MACWTCLWLLALGVVGTSFAEMSDQPSDNSSLYRLPKDVFPESYDLLLLTDLTSGNFTYEGELDVRLSVVERTRRVVLHAYKTIALLEEKTRLARLAEDDPDVEVKEERIKAQKYDQETQFYVVETEEDLLPGGRYLLRLSFVGQVVDDVFGFYRSSHRAADGETRWIGVTQFSSIFARWAFPCMDEPGFRATFQLSIGHRENETVTSNTLPESVTLSDRKPGNDYYVSRFSRTPRMSTYLLGWVIHCFTRVNSSDPRIWLWTRSPAQAHWDKAPALVEGPKIYSTLEKWMDLPNPVAKIEHFAVPDFFFSAMENWGLITFRESVPLVSYESTSSKDIHSKLLTMAHEYSHTWFGNIVTMDFWDHAWIKEGFATYFAYLSLSMLDREPEVVMEDLFTLENMHASMISDSAKHSRTMNGQGIGSPKSCRLHWDFVTYEKAASIIRMFAEVVGKDVFKEAMHGYLRDKQYTAAVPKDIYEHLESARKSRPDGIPVSIEEFVESWANQPNYPLVRAYRAANGSLTLSQRVFQFAPRAESNQSRFWWIPLNIAAGDQVLETWLGSELTRQVQLPPSDWYLVNHRQFGYYRVDYDDDNWSALRGLLNSENFRRLKSVDRAGLLDDAFNLARAGFRDYELPLELARYLRREEDYAPWAAASSALRLIDDKLRDRPDIRAAFRRYASELLTPIYKKLTFETLPSDSRVRRMHRSLVLSAACSIDLVDCVSNAKSIFDHWIADENKVIPADLKAFVYRVGIVNGSGEHWISLRLRFFKAELHSEKEPMMQALASSEDPAFVNELLELAVQPSADVAKQNRLSIVKAVVAGSSRNIETMLDYLRDNLTEVIRLRGEDFLADALSAIGKEITSIVQNDKLTQFVETNASLLGSALEAGKKAMESASNNIAWINTCASQVSNYLNSKFERSSKMNRLISIIFLACLIAVEARSNYPITFDTNNDVLFEDAKAKITYRLPTTVKPKNYNLRLQPFFVVDDNHKAFTFDAEVKISFGLLENVENITFHSRNLTFKSIKLEKGKDTIKVVLKDENEDDLKRDFKVITSESKEKFVKGTDYVLTIVYIGILHNDMRGFYRSSYKNDDGEVRWLATTHFEPYGARRAFPCFDEPQYKATFDVSIIHPEVYNAISNGAVKSTAGTGVGTGLKITTFHTTPIMSTYLLAFVVSDFKSKANMAENFTVYARPNAIKHADLAVKTGEKLLKALANYTGIEFEIPKMDQAAIPDFAAGAMENWGLVLYREKSLLYDENDMTSSEKQNIVETIAHEFAHQWFGDLVSPVWWKYLWLNEGFANFFQSFITQKVIPEWRTAEQAVVKSIQTTAFDFDSGRTTHPINQNVESPDEISAIFDNISYSKAGAVIRMMQHFLTETVFKKGLTAYLTGKNHGAANSDDLFSALQNEAKDNPKNVKEIMDTWVNQKGYPVVKVTRNYDKDGTVKIQQERFVNYILDKGEQVNQTWHVPINYATEKKSDFDKTTADLWLTKAEETVKIDAKPDQWLIVNKQQTGFYRVNYDEKNWNLIIKTLTSGKHEKIHLLNRAQLINDALAFVKQNTLNLSTLLHMTAYLTNETDYVAWYPGYKAFMWLNAKLINTEHHEIFKEHVVNTTKSVVESVGFDESKDPTNEEGHLTKINRNIAINLACSVGSKQCTTTLNEKFEKWLNDSTKNPLKPDLKQATLCNGLRTASADVWNRTLSLCVKTTNSVEKADLINALGCSTDENILRYYINYVAEDDSPIGNYMSSIIRSISEQSDVGVNLALDFVTERFNTLYRKLLNEIAITGLITSIGEKITTQEQLDKLKATEHKDVHKKFTSLAIAAAENNIKWVKNNNDALVAWTKELKGNGVSIASASAVLISTIMS